MDEQRDDITVVEAEQRVVVARRMREDGLDVGLGSPAETGGHGCGPGQVSQAALHWRTKGHSGGRPGWDGAAFWTGVSLVVPELRSEDGLRGVLGSGLNMLASGLIFSGGAGGGVSGLT